MRLIRKLAVTGFFLIMLFALPALSDDAKQVPASEGPTALPALAAGDIVIATGGNVFREAAQPDITVSLK